MNEQIKACLAALYGEATAAAVTSKFEHLIERYREKLPQPIKRRECLPLTQRDALLIAYADQVREDCVAPLRTLAVFCEQRLAGVVSGIHILLALRRAAERLDCLLATLIQVL